jgi:hypothetical protein
VVSAAVGVAPCRYIRVREEMGTGWVGATGMMDLFGLT